MNEALQTNAAGDVLFESDGAIAIATLNRPQARNALTFAMYDRLAEICRDMRPDGDVRALIVTGSGDRAFAAGTDISQFRAFRTEADAQAYEQNIERVLTAIETCAVPTIAAIAGACTGGGAGIAARIGAGRVMEVIFTARLIDAEEAKAIGLISEVLEDQPALMARARELATLLAGHAPLTLRATKEALRRIRQGRRDDADLIASCYTSEDFREGLEAFLQKRPAKWQGR